MVTLTIDGKTATVPAGSTILEAAQQVGIRIPTLCWLQKVSPTGACRICVVEIEGVARPMTACNTPVKEGIVVTTQSEKLRAIRKQVVELLLVNHPLDCPVCDAGGECDLQNICYELNVTQQPFVAEDVNPPVINGWPLIQQVPNRCILCEKCVKVCHETIGASALFVNDKGDRSFIDKNLNLCEFCGNCVAVCPTGTMISKTFKFKARPWELTKVPTVCTYCGSHCQVDLNVKQGKVLRVTSEDGVTVNDGNLCIGGFFGHGYLDSPKRLIQPMIRQGDALAPTTWDEALNLVAGKLRDAGGAAVAALGSARLSNEDNYLMQKFFRAAVGTNNLDSDSRFGALRAFKTLNGALGAVGATNSIDNLAKADVVLVFAADVTAEAPALDWKIQQSCRKADGKLVVANMRQVKLTRYANSHLAYRPGSEIALAEALAKLIVEKGLVDEAVLGKQVGNFAELKKALAAVDVKKAAAVTGVSEVLLNEAATYLGKGKNVAVLFGSDLTRAAGAEEKIAALVNLALVCGVLGSEFGGLYPLDEKGNTQGLVDMGMAADLLPGPKDYTQARGEFEKLWNTTLPASARDALAILEGVEKGEIKVLYLIATNPLVSYPESGRWRKALEKVEFLVVQDILASDLESFADVVLPAAAVVEKNGSVTSLDHQLSKLGKARNPLGEARADLDIFAALYRLLDPKAEAITLDSITAEIKQTVPVYGSVGPCGGERCRYALRLPFVSKEKGLSFTPVKAATAAGEGMHLLSGKLLFHFGTTSTYAEGNLEVADSGYVEMNTADAQKLGVKDGDAVKVTSTVASVTGKIKVGDKVPAGLLFAPYHFADLNIQQLMPAGSNLVAVSVTKA
ncbi:molybdopterin-dependent oxidoreductase [Trichloromonas sp.]|uniref:molybdopterin-dependent oxidoreductase n=1 Tax=Trichloromonas sp. TaxID=3069249 RepID=UPI002A49DE47|nr:molybdopterin-dependent oxidoreductase [Trichloromonas sp.]